MSDLGRISGPMLKDNLLRDGVDLVFENTFGDNNLYLDVNTRKIGINTDSLPRELTINDSGKTTNLIVDTLFNVDLLEIDGVNNIITNLTGDVILGTDLDTVTTPRLETDSLVFDDNYVGTKLSNASIELKPSGTGRVTFESDLHVTGNLHTVGDVTLGGNIILGSDDSDSVTFNTDIKTDILPDQSDLYDLGKSDRKWDEVRSRQVNGEFLIAGNFEVENVNNIALRPGNIWFVSSNGSDTNQGNHENGPFASIKKALTVAQNGDSIKIYPGDYVEEFPLTVPTGVSINGSGIRAVTVRPTLATKDKDAFLLNGETTVSDLTVRDYFYNSINNTGYAFRFAQNFEVTSRSPYIQNVTMITQKSGIPGSNDAGRGALVDGSAATSSSREASMLFHSITMIIPDAIGLYMTNGVRVEWLNSFTYYANKGLYATNGVLGRFDGVTTNYGAELRSIGSANVYGTVGAEVDGIDTLMYLINHNFAYIGLGTLSNNDPSIVNQDNEAVTLNGGRIYWQSLDQRGDFKIGEAFIVDQETGFVTLNGIGQGSGGINNITISNGISVTEITELKVETGNIRFSGNTISSTDGPVIFDSFTGEINLDQNVAVNQNLTVVDDFSIKGQLTIGNQIVDRVSFSADVTSDLIPKQDKLYDLGSDPLKWNTVFVDNIDMLDLKINDNRIFTTNSNSNLELAASGTGSVEFVSNLIISNNLDVNGTAYLSNIVTGPINHTGSTLRTGNFILNGNYDLSGLLNLNRPTLSFSDIQISENRILTLNSNSDLELKASGIGEILIPKNDVEIDNDLYVSNISSTTIINNQVFSSGTFTNGTFTLNGNQILSNIGINFITAGTGKINFKSDTITSTDLTVGDQTDLKNLNVTGILDRTGNTIRTGSTIHQGIYDLTGNLIVSNDVDISDISISNNEISYTLSNGDLELRANGSGQIEIENTNVQIDQDLMIEGTGALASVSGSNLVESPIWYTDDIKIENNSITTTLSNSNLELTAPAGKNIVIDDSSRFEDNLTILTNTDLSNLNILGNIVHVGNRISVITNHIQIGTINLTGNITVSNQAEISDVSIIDNIISTVVSNADLELIARPEGTILINDTDVLIENNLTARTVNSDDITVIDKLTVGSLSNENIKIEGNLIEATLSNSDLELNANGAGSIIARSDIFIQNNLTLSSNLFLTRSNPTNLAATIDADIQIQNNANALLTQLGVRNQIGDFDVVGNFNNSFATLADFSNIQIQNNKVKTSDSNSDLELRASGTGVVRIPTNTDLSQDLTIGGTLYLPTVQANSIIGNLVSNENIVITGNVVKTTLSNSDLELRANGTGIILIPSNNAQIVSDLTVSGIVSVKNTQLTSVNHNGLLTRTGISQQTGTYSITGNLTASSEARFDNINFVNNRISTTNSQSDLDLRAAGTGKVVFNENISITESLFVGKTLSANTVNIQVLTDADSLFDGNIRIKDNFIETTIGNDNLRLIGNNNGGVLLENTLFKDNTIAPTSANTNINLSLINNNVLINGSEAVKLPIGTTAQRTVGIQGDLRFNSSSGFFEGWNVSRKPLNGIFSANLQTSIRASDSTNILNFITGGIAAMEVTTSKIRTNGLRIDNNILIDGNTFTSSSNSDINLTPNGTGRVILGDTTVTGNEFLNLSSTQPMTFSHTGFGYLKFNSTTAVVIPVGDNTNRPTSPELGDLRFNTDLSIPEVFNGIAYTTLAGNTVNATIEQIQELNEIYAILLG